MNANKPRNLKQAQTKRKLIEQQEHVVTGLDPKTRYSLSVAAFTVKGAGPMSDVKYATTLGKGEAIVGGLFLSLVGIGVFVCHSPWAASDVG